MLTRLQASIGVLLAVATSSAGQSQQFSWQMPHAKVLPTGDIQWRPMPFRLQASGPVRYIDFERGSDANPGVSPTRPWKHHPWDPEAQGISRSGAGAETFVFKRGVLYRGRLIAPAYPGTKRLTSDPAWGAGAATITGAELVTGWKRGGPPLSPNSQTIWHAELPFAPRRVWIRTGLSLKRLTLARTPNWTESNPDDLKAGWWEWENPEWWTGSLKTTIDGTRMHLGVDAKHLNQPAETYRDALVWSEYGIVMGSPFASRIEAFESVRKSVAFQGPWMGDGEQIITGNRYYLEDKPQFLDQPGEFWFDRRGPGGTLYLRAPNDIDPNPLQIEAARYSTLLEAARVGKLLVSGLSFQAANTFYDLTQRPFVDQDIESAGIRLLGSAGIVEVANCRFEGLTGGVRIKAAGDADFVGTVRVRDSVFADLDRYAIDISDSSRWAKVEPPFSTVNRVEVLRNHVRRIGLRGGRDCHGHTIVVGFPITAEVAGNVVERVGGAGIFVFGGKGSGELRDRPLSRILIHHNRVSEPLLMSNDWGGIETWQGGPHYVYNNVSYNPGGYWHWSFLQTRGKRPEDVDWGAARQGFAYYLDGSSKNYLFNNIAAGKSNELGSALCNSTAFQMPIGFQNTFFNNTAYRFATAVRRQAPRAGRDKWLGNIFEDMSAWAFLSAEPRGADKDANAFQFQDVKGDNYSHETNAFGSNVFNKLPREFGVFEENGTRHKTLAEFAAARKRRMAMRSDTGVSSSSPVLADPKQADYRPRAGSAATDRGVRVFVPWALSGVVSEWNFVRNDKDPSQIIDEHWNMAPYYVGREQYWQTPRHSLTALGSPKFVDGVLEDWTRGALKLDGANQRLVARHSALVAPYSYQATGGRRTASGLQIASPQIGTGNLLIEAVLATKDHDGVIARKLGPIAGYQLELVGGRPSLRLRVGGTDVLVATSAARVADGRWRHILAEVDRRKGTAIYVDGKITRLETVGNLPVDSLVNNADFEVGTRLAASFDFLRVCRGTLADSQTTIRELYAWEFGGPQLRDFAGNKPQGNRRDAGALEISLQPTTP